MFLNFLYILRIMTNNTYASKFRYLYIFQAKDIINIHNTRCPNPQMSVQVSTDGVSEAKSNSNSLDVYSARFSHCRTVYPFQILRPIGKYRLDQQEYLDRFLTDLCTNGICIRCFVGDNPKRAIARASKSHSSYYPCEYCEARGKLLQTEDNNFQARKAHFMKQKNTIMLKLSLARQFNDIEEIDSLTTALRTVNDAIKMISSKNNNIVWPASTQNGSPRTTEKVLAITDRIENGDALTLDEAKGIVGRSLFLDIPYFNYVDDISVEYLHGVCLGTVKRLTSLTFNVGDSRKRNTTRKLSLVSQFNILMSQIQGTREFSRRARCLDFAVMKGQEFRNLILFYFPLVLMCIEEGEKERNVWLLLAYMVRLCILPNNEYEQVDPEVLKTCGQEFYVLYEQLFHARNCTYNTHMVAVHLPQIRIHGPLTVTSAFGFESFYGELRHSFVPGTTSPLKQIMQKVLLKRVIGHHCCKPSIFYSTNESGLETNCYIYTYSEFEYHFYKIISIEENSMTCLMVEKHEKHFPETPNLNWGKVGVFTAGNVTEDIVSIEKNDIAGKIIRVRDLFLTCPINVLEEK